MAVLKRSIIESFFPEAQSMGLRLMPPRFHRPGVEKQFERDYYASFLRQSRLSILFGIIALGAFGHIDVLFFSPPTSTYLLALRYGIGVSGFLLGLLLTYWVPTPRALQWTLAGIVVWVGLSVLAMIYVGDNPTVFGYYVGIIFCLVFGYAFMKCRFLTATAAGAALVMAYILSAVWFLPMGVDHQVVSISFIVAYDLIGMVIGYSIEYHDRREFYLRSVIGQQRAHLQAANAALEDRVQQRTVELQSERDLLQKLMDSAPDFVFVKDRSLRYLRSNPAHAAALGVDGPQELVGKTDDDLFPELVAEPLRREELELLESGVPIISRERQVFHNGRGNLWVSVTKIPLYDEAGQVAGLLGYVRDLTEHRQLEAQFRQSQKMEAMGRLAGGVAHDFNNLLTGIMGYAQLLLGNPRLDPQTTADIQEISKAADQAAALTRQLLAFGRKQVLRPEILDLNQVIQETQKMLRRLIGEDVLLETRLQPDLGPVKADPGQINQVLINMAVNARDAMPKGGRLMIETYEKAVATPPHVEASDVAHDGRYAVIAMGDNGVGMDQNTLAHLYEPFFTTKAKGTGLGLATVYGIITQSGGWIDVESQVGQGTTFFVHLPIAAHDTPQPVQAAPSVNRSGSEVILVVEDNEGVRTLAERILRGQGYHVLLASNGQDAVARYGRDDLHIDLLITDVIMPGMSGRELAATFAGRFPQMRVLFMSGYTDNTTVAESIAQPDAAYLQKPFSPRSLTDKVREVMDHSMDETRRQ